MLRSTPLRVALFFLLGLAVLPMRSDAQDDPSASPDLLLILDASGSMWGQIGGENKIVIARRVLKDLVGELPGDAEVGLVAYGHRRKGDCDDIETVILMGRLNQEAMIQHVDALDPKGKTPITQAVQEAFASLQSRERGTTVVLISDGVETCGGDPCQAVRDAKASGLSFVMHVVGFDVAAEDVSQLECAAQAGDGLYFDAQNADALAGALEQAVDAPAEALPEARLSVKALADGNLVDVTVRIYRADTGEEIPGGRTYASPETNPRVIPLDAGTYDVEVRAVGFKGNIRQRFEGIEVAKGDTVHQVVDFSTGELAVGVTHNGELSDATVRVLVAGTTEQIAGNRTYTSSSSNPAVFRLTAGTYDVEVGSVEIAGAERRRFEGVVVEAGGRVERAHEFKSGTLRLGAVNGSELVDATVYVYNMDTGKAVDQGRTYTSPNSNPRVFVVPPGRYRIEVKGIRLEGRPERAIEVTLEAGQTVEQTVDFGG
ncbi:MAG: VWA domain-containing protein [Rhodothermales bacterium]